MHFKRLELYGFKSFAEKTKLEFEPGITAIVGPNGCGKSNISDSIKWVLGEQSARELRGLKMEDVIFNGTSLKEPVNFAEVSLTLSNEAKVLPIEYEEITVARRLFRSGESEYLLNRTPVRLKDIQELFMGTGIGISAYSLLEQGKMDMILSSKTDDRRFVFEEAAGITKFKSQKRETLRRLGDTENNLLRVNDIVIEIKRQISSIERQARKAQRYKEIFNLVKDKELKINKYNYIQLEKQLREIQADKDTLKVQENSSSVSLNEIDSKIKGKRAALDSIEQDISDFQSNELNFNSEIEKNQNKITLDRERIEELDKRSKFIVKETADLLERIDAESKELLSIKGQSDDFIKSLEIRKAGLKEKQELLASIDSQLKEKEKSISGSKLSLINLVQDLSAVRNELTKVKTENASLSARLRRLELEKNRTQEEKDRFLDVSDRTKKVLEGKRNELDKVVEQIEVNHTAVSRLNEESAQLTDKFHRLDKQSQSLNSRIEFLEEMKTRYEGYSPGVKSLLMAKKKGELELPGVLDVLANVIEVEKGYEQAVEAALGSYAQAFIIRDYRTLQACLEYTERLQLGEIVFIVLEGLENKNPYKPESGKGWVYLRDFVRSMPEYMAVLEYLLDNFIVVDDIKQVLQSARENNDRFLKWITPRGEMMEGNIVRTVPFALNEDLNIIGRDRKIRELKEASVSLEAARGDTLDKKNSISMDLDRLGEELKLAEERKDVYQVEIGGLEQEVENLDKGLKRLTDELEVLDLELAELDEELRDNQAKMGENEQSLRQLESKESELNKLIEDCNNFTIEKNSLRETTLIEVTELDAELKSFTERMDIFKGRIASLEKSLSEQREMLAARKNEEAEAGERIRNLHGEIALLEKSNLSLTEDRAGITGKLADLRKERAALRIEIENEEGSFREKQAELDKLRANSHELEINSQELNFKLNNIVDKMNTAYKVNLETDDIELSIDEFDYDDAKREFALLEDKLDAIGPVNLVAIDEHQQLQERYSFLLSQQEDLNKAKESLHEAINKINRTAKELFMETFKKIEVSFKEIFRLLFGGGNAQLLLVESQDVLESGIEIVAQPPGKKLQNISLLSGGEKALTAAALLFAIFKVKPSPFCILDEVDAPLDEANIDRFRMLMKEFSKTSQFIVITHNKKTISIADVMYGITMQESGVSKIVSVKFSEPGAARAF